MAIRQSLGLTQEQLAKRLEVPMNHINYLECQAFNPRLKTVQRLADFFGVTPDYFFVENAGKDDLGSAFEEIRQLPTEKQQKFLDLTLKFLEEDS